MRPYHRILFKTKAPAAAWHRIGLNATQLHARDHERIRLAFNFAYMTARRRKGMSLWLAACDDGADVYLSPAAVAAEPSLVDRFHATPSEPPDRALSWLAGESHELGLTRQKPGQLRTNTARREHLPTLYRCRSVRQAIRLPQTERQALAPFVRRYLKAWPQLGCVPAAAHKSA